jgi:outer membrane protein OmpU
MRILLLTTTAVALATGMTTGTRAEAADWEIAVGGYFETYAAYAAPDVDGFVDDEFDGVDSKIEPEIHFQPSITLDNGLQIGADVQLEGTTANSDQIDESYLFVDGQFGRVLLGSADSAGYLMHYGAPDVTFVNINSGSMTIFVPFSGTAFGELSNGALLIDTDEDGTADASGLQVGDDVFYGTLGSTYIENRGNSDAQRFTYFTPRFAGLQFGVSYARDEFEDDQQQLNLDGNPLNDIVDVGANYVNSLGAFDVVVSGRWGIGFDDRDEVPGTDIGENPQLWAAGLNLGYAGVTVGGSFGEQNNAGVQDGRAWDAGIAYTTGPWGVSFTYFNGENVDDEADGDGAVDALAAGGVDEELAQYLLGVSYDLATGVALNAFGAYVEFDEETGDAGGPNEATGDDVDGWVVGTGIKINF